MLPAQVLVQNLCFDAAQLAFAHDRPAPSALPRPSVLDPRELLRFIVGFGALNAVADLATFGVLAFALRGPGDDEALFHSGWFTENLLTQAVVMVLLSFGRGGRGGRGGRRPGPVTWSAAGLAGVGLLIPASPVGAALGLSPLPGVYYGLLAAVLALYAVALTAARTRHERVSAATVAQP
jgi:Mg2+-importing ATPase